MEPELTADRSEADRSVAYATAIDGADSFAELIGVVTEYGRIEGSQRTYSRGELVERITLIKALAEAGYEATPADFGPMTRSLGLRHSCEELYADYRQTDDN